jgi:flagellar protein FlbT
MPAGSSDIKPLLQLCERGQEGRGRNGGLNRHERENPMSNLVLELRQGDMMIVNGASIRFRTKTRIELAAKARFLFGKQIMPPDDANTPARRIYFALQTAYIGTDEERAAGLSAARHRIMEFQEATTSALAREILERALVAAQTDDCYAALKLVRRVIRHEDAVLGRTGA